MLALTPMLLLRLLQIHDPDTIDVVLPHMHAHTCLPVLYQGHQKTGVHFRIGNNSVLNLSSMIDTCSKSHLPKQSCMSEIVPDACRRSFHN